MKRTWKLTEQQKNEVAKRYGSGEKLAAIAADFEVHGRTVIQIARVRGHGPRNPGRPPRAS